MDPYKVLGVDRKANEETIKSAYKRLAKKWHPDLFQDEAKIKEATRKMKEINEAYDILKDQKKRFAYDAESSSSVNIYEYYASKQTEERPKRWRRNKKSPDLENEKRRRAVLQFFEEEKKRRKDILDMVQELRECVVSGEFSDEEYIETLELILEELRDCIATIKSIISTAKEKQITGLEASFAIAEQIIAELTGIEKETPKTLKEAQYVEETKRLAAKIDELMGGFLHRINKVRKFDILSKTWEFENDSQVKEACEAHIREADELIADLQWVKKTSAERNIQIGLIDLKGFNLQSKGNLDYCIDKVSESKSVLQCSLQELRKKFWSERCEYSEKSKRKKKVFEGVEIDNVYKGNFIVPPDIDVLGEDALRWLRKMNSITIPARLIYPGIEITLPLNYGEEKRALKQLIFTFETHSEVVDISKIAWQIITREGEYICIRDEYSKPSFALACEKETYIYDDEKLCKLNGVPDVKQLENISPWWELCRHWEGYPLQVHTWAQVVQKLPHPAIMQGIPTSIEAIMKWILLDKPNFEKVFSSVEEKFKKRTVRLYIALGALNGETCHAQAEWLISKLDPSKMYRSRLERVPNRNKKNPDPVLSVPKSIVDLVQAFITEQEFLPYVFAFLEGHQLFESEAKKANVGISPKFIAKVAPQYIFHEKVDKPASFIKELLETEEEIAPKIADRIVRIYNIAQTKLEGGTKKKIIKTDDVSEEGVVHYRFLDTQSLQTYLIFEEEFKTDDDSRGYYAVEAENVFLSNNSHAIEIINGEERIGVAILNLFDKGELFADIVLNSVTNKSIEFLEAVRRALIDQKNCNSLVTAISIGTDEAATTGRYNPWREVVKDADADWAKGVKWIKFEYLFENKLLGISYKGYRARFILEGEGQYFDKPNPYISPKKERELERDRYRRLNDLRWY